MASIQRGTLLEEYETTEVENRLDGDDDGNERNSLCEAG
jgi:hypothetical protein